MKFKLTSTRKYNVWKKFDKDYNDEKKRVMKQIGNIGVKTIKDELVQRKIKNRSGDLVKKISYKINKDYIEWISGSQHHKYINFGVKPHKMIYLLKSRRPIPLQINGKTVYRWATAKSMKKGKWRHPGFTKGKGYFENGIQRALANSKSKLTYISKLFK